MMRMCDVASDSKEVAQSDSLPERRWRSKICPLCDKPVEATQLAWLEVEDDGTPVHYHASCWTESHFPEADESFAEPETEPAAAVAEEQP